MNRSAISRAPAVPWSSFSGSRAPSAEVLKRLRSGDAAERDAMRERMEAAVMQQLDPEAAPWLSAIVAGMDARVPEPPIPGGRLVR